MQRVGIDTGGTFTDLVGLDEDSGKLFVSKHPSTPENPAVAVGAALDAVAGHISDLRRLVVGTTVATNAIIQRRGATVLFLTTAGFEDVPFIQRINKAELYNLHWQKPRPLVLRRHCLGVVERVSHQGEVITPLTDLEMQRVIHRVADLHAREAVDAVAICLLFSYLNPEHERRLTAALQEVLPDLAISVSSSVCPVWREYERGSTTVADAFVRQTINLYIDNVDAELHRRGHAHPWYIIRSNGGRMRADTARETPVQTVLSGLAAGVIGGREYGAMAGFRDVFTLDMGGTSSDVGVVEQGRQSYTTEFDLAFGLPVMMPCIDISTIGAGGGSIAWMDRGGFLQVGPQSAGAMPGPAGYGRGGTDATVTDANVVLGRLNPDYFLGGRLRLDAGLARAAVGRVAERMGVDLVQAASAIIQTSTANMANQIRLISVRKGLDPREFALVAFGGAGPVQATDIAVSLGIPHVVVPPHPGLCSAFGALITDVRVDRVRTYRMRSDTARPEEVQAVFDELTAAVLAQLAADEPRDQAVLLRSIEMRYLGQNYEREVAVPDGPLDAAALAEILRRFASVHEQFYGFQLEHETIELVNFHVTLLLPARRPRLEPLPLASGPPEPYTTRPVYFAGTGVVQCPIFRRDDLELNHELVGPAIIEEVDSTTVVTAGHRLRVVEAGALVIDVQQRQEGVAWQSTTQSP